jgi:hypothetical protein
VSEDEPIFSEAPDLAISLFYGPVAELIIALKRVFDLEKDVVLMFGDLGLRFHEHSKYAEVSGKDMGRRGIDTMFV